MNINVNISKLNKFNYKYQNHTRHIHIYIYTVYHHKIPAHWCDLDAYKSHGKITSLWTFLQGCAPSRLVVVVDWPPMWPRKNPLGKPFFRQKKWAEPQQKPVKNTWMSKKKSWTKNPEANYNWGDERKVYWGQISLRFPIHDHLVRWFFFRML